VSRVKIIKDPETGLPKGFAFVSYSEPEQAKAAMRDLNGTEIKGRKIVVNEAKTKQPEDPLRPVFNGRGGNPNRKVRKRTNGNF
jgi:RNA recognition motif-containing protein